MSRHDPLADRFIKAYNGISAWLDRRLPPEFRERGMSQFQRKLREVSKTDSAVRKYSHELEKLAYLRNAIVHDEDYPSRVVAEPHEEVVLRIEAIFQALTGRVTQTGKVPTLKSAAVPNEPMNVKLPVVSRETLPVIVHAWNNSSWHPSGAGYGIRMPHRARDTYFDRGWDKVTLVFGDDQEAEARVSPSFWQHVPALRCAALGRWLIELGRAPWPPGQPPALRLTRIGERVFRVETT